MIRRFNYTSRIDLPHNLFAFSVSKTDPPAFDAQWSDLGEFRLPPDAAVYVEAYSSHALAAARFSFGTVGVRTEPASKALDQIFGNRIHFNFFVVDTSNEVGKLLAIARQIPTSNANESDGSVNPLLPVNPASMGRRIWRVNLEPPTGDGRPWLEVNKLIPDWPQRLKHDRMFFSLVYPEAIRQILHFILVKREFHDPHAGTGWESQWMRWGVFWHPQKQLPPTIENENEQVAWINDVVDSFCAQHDTLDKFIQPTTEVAP